mmetsp:Transcript_41785/g.116520  ORF Transcript_41785/g.116520 Transcript_41785/m.116520 type:complete len:283 (+) Transcript_41785:1590-2438(+)
MPSEPGTRLLGVHRSRRLGARRPCGTPIPRGGGRRAGAEGRRRPAARGRGPRAARRRRSAALGGSQWPQSVSGADKRQQWQRPGRQLQLEQRQQPHVGRQHAEVLTWRAQQGPSLLQPPAPATAVVPPPSGPPAGRPSRALGAGPQQRPGLPSSQSALGRAWRASGHVEAFVALSQECLPLWRPNATPGSATGVPARHSAFLTGAPTGSFCPRAPQLLVKCGLPTPLARTPLLSHVICIVELTSQLSEPRRSRHGRSSSRLSLADARPAFSVKCQLWHDPAG